MTERAKYIISRATLKAYPVQRIEDAFPTSQYVAQATVEGLLFLPSGASHDIRAILTKNEQHELEDLLRRVEERLLAELIATIGAKP